MLKAHGYEGYKEAWEGHKLVSQWAPVQPKDREALVNELVNLASADLQSIEQMVERLGNAEDSEEELELIKAWMEFKMEVERGKNGKEVGTESRRAEGAAE